MTLSAQYVINGGRTAYSGVFPNPQMIDAHYNPFRRNKNEPRLEARFLLACLRDDARVAEYLSPVSAARSLNWNYLLNLAYAHGLISLLHLKLNAFDAILPKEIASYLENNFRANALRNRMLREEFSKVMAIFFKANIRVIPLKGIVYSQTLYSVSSARQFADIDFLVREADIEHARQVLQDSGYHTVYDPTLLAPGHVELSAPQALVYRAVYHEYEMQSRDKLINIDLHWRLSPRMYPTGLPTDLVWHDLRPADINGVAVSILSDELDILYLCIHAAKDGWSELKWAVDISELIRNRDMLRWDEVWRFCQLLRCKNMVLVGLGLAHWISGVALPKFVVEEIASCRTALRAIEKLQQRLLTTPDRTFSRVPCLLLNKTYLQLCDSVTDKLRYVFRTLTYAQAGDFQLLGLTPTLLPVWSWIRPFRLSVHCIAKALAKRRNLQAR